MSATDPQTLPLDVALQQAVAYHQGGRLAEAEELYRAVLAVEPNQQDANHNLGVLACQLGQHLAGLPYLKTALAVNPAQGLYALSYAEALLLTGEVKEALNIIQAAMQRGLNTPAAQSLRQRAESASRIAQKSVVGKGSSTKSLPQAECDQLAALFRTGRHAELESRSRLLLEQYPESGLVWKMLWAALHLQGNEALYALKNAARFSPDDAGVHNNLGVAWRDLGQLDDAVASFRQALAIKPDYVEAHYNLGNALRELGQLDDAVARFRRVLKIKPDYVEAHNNIGVALQDLGQFDGAAASLRQALAIKPDYAEAHYNLGNALRELGQLDHAMASFQRALEIDPDYAEACSNLGVTLKCQGQLDDAVVSLRRALEIKPNYAEAHNNLGNALRDLGQLDRAMASFQRALEIKPDFAEARFNLGVVWQDRGELDDALASYRRALEIKPDYVDAHSNLLFTLNYHPDTSGEEIFAAYREYDERFALPQREKWRTHSNDRDANRRLKVGYVSPDFREHSCRYFLEPLLAHHDKSIVDVHAYAELSDEDAVTARYQGYVDHWVPTRGMSDDAVAERIRADGIDILVDLAGHTAKNRLQVFARKPAPVSVSWLGYGYTTGLSAIDYYLTDEATVPTGSERLFSETPWRLATPSYAYRPAEGMGLVSPLPAIERGYVTFGTLTRSVRIHHRTIRVWSEILKRVEGARLVIDSGSFRNVAMQEALAEKFSAHGIGPERLAIGYHSPPWDVLRGIDIGLDCFPHNSGTTLIETLYMGVPFVTLAGRPSVGRLGSSILNAAGHAEWIASSEDEYVEIVVAMATDLPKLATWRDGLRKEMESAPLMDETGFARKVEAAYRGMWARWCEG